MRDVSVITSVFCEMDSDGEFMRCQDYNGLGWLMHVKQPAAAKRSLRSYNTRVAVSELKAYSILKSIVGKPIHMGWESSEMSTEEGKEKKLSAFFMVEAEMNNIGLFDFVHILKKILEQKEEHHLIHLSRILWFTLDEIRYEVSHRP